MNKRDETMRMVKEVESKLETMNREEKVKALASLVERESEASQELERLEEETERLQGELLRAKRDKVRLLRACSIAEAILEVSKKFPEILEEPEVQERLLRAEEEIELYTPKSLN